MSTKVLIRCVAVLTVAIIGLAIADNARLWKRLQIEYFELGRQQLRSRLVAARAGVSENLLERVRSQEEILAGRRDEIAQLEDDLRRFRGKSRAARQRRSRLRSQLELTRWRRETTAGETTTATDTGKLTEELRQTRMEIESIDELVADRDRKLGAVRSELDAAREQLAQGRSPVEALESRLADFPAPPMLPLAGVLAPGVKVREIAFHLPAGGTTGRPAWTSRGPQARRVDRCVTCHLGAVRDDVDSEDWPAPFRSHPRGELFLGADSPHPYQRFGCTACHDGEGRATDFSRAGHQPVTSEQAIAWTEKWGWRRQDRLVPMLPLDLTEAACGRCHGGSVFVPQAQDLDLGRQLIVDLGCTACHASDHPSPRALPGVGPSLVGIAAKTSPAWTHRWLEAPRAVRPTTRMPHFFDLGDTSAEGRPDVFAGRRQATEIRAAEIRAVVDTLWQLSRLDAYAPPPAGEPEAGRALFEAVGCRGCHLLGSEADSPASPEQRHGPHLAGTGSKVTAGWLYNWLLSPRVYSKDTPMPSLRLDEREAADLTAYLMTRRDPAWEDLSLPAIDAETRDRMVLSALARGDTLEQSQARLDRMSERDKNIYLGERTIARYGCTGCHEIAGLEQTPAIGPTLAEVSLELRGALAVPSRGPGARGRWQASSHRPAYRLSDDEAKAVTVALLGLAENHATQDEQTVTLARGRRVLARYNCRGCHRIEGRGGLDATVRATSPDDIPPDGISPDLADVGARLNASWLYAYLSDPGRVKVRPWLETRMPTFGLSEAENNALVRYFAVRNDHSLFAGQPPAPRPEVDVAVGRVVFGMLQCGDCHHSGHEESSMPGLAPPYGLASERLRPDWVIAWILDPERWLPGTQMPASFLPGKGEELDSSFLIGSLDTPIFDVDRERLLGLLGSEQALHAYLSDPERVAAALRDYLWTLGE